MKRHILEYKTLIFDCDGVVLDSNCIKTEAFYQSTKGFGEYAAQELMAYHINHGGISRYKKFAYFLEYIAPKYSKKLILGLEQLLHLYSKHVYEGLLRCAIAPSLKELRKSIPNSRWLIVSGGDQEELRSIFATRGIDKWFDGGIFGSPDNKNTIIMRELSLKNIEIPALFIGDSKYDFQVATEFNLDFVFMSEWSDVVNWSSWTEANKICHLSTVASLLKK